MILQALKLSLFVAAAATALVACAGTWTGWLLARRRFRGRELVDALLHLPLVLPPTVTGYYLIVLLGRRGLLGGPLHSATGWSVPFSWVACVIAASVMAFPLMVRAARVAFEEIDPRHELVAASLGHGRASIFWKVMLPLGRRGLAAGLVLAFARALGEFGATLMVAGNIPGRTQTLPLLIYEAMMTGEDRLAFLLSLLLTAVSVTVMLVAGRLGETARMNGLDVDIGLERRGDDGSRFRLAAAFASGPGITVVCGASGAGKTSLLLSILGALRPARGSIRLDGRTLFDAGSDTAVPIRGRRIGMVLQDVPLFPHLNAGHNVQFGMQGQDREARTRKLLERVGAEKLYERRPSELSGGQLQRVALARALGASPRALLLDEPFSALDPAGRQALGQVLIDLQTESRIPFVHVTHDMGEALRLGTSMVLLDRGTVAQVGPPSEVIARPGSIAAARAVGTENIVVATVLRHLPDDGCTEVEFEGTRVQTGLLDCGTGSEILLGLRAEDILLSLQPVDFTSARNVLAGAIEDLVRRGNAVEVRVTTPAPLRALVTPASVRDLKLEAGKRVYLLIKAAAIHRLEG